MGKLDSGACWGTFLLGALSRRGPRLEVGFRAFASRAYLLYIALRADGAHWLRACLRHTAALVPRVRKAHPRPSRGAFRFSFSRLPLRPSSKEAAKMGLIKPLRGQIEYEKNRRIAVFDGELPDGIRAAHVPLRAGGQAVSRRKSLQVTGCSVLGGGQTWNTLKRERDS